MLILKKLGYQKMEGIGPEIFLDFRALGPHEPCIPAGTRFQQFNRYEWK
jgi:hypothetical protein